MPRAPATPPQGTGVGLRNVADRLLVRYQGAGALNSGAMTPLRYRAALDLPLLAG